jgi:lipopolysaccharide/colanic/teichoic acid biosynthesis glycosyltransferase
MVAYEVIRVFRVLVPASVLALFFFDVLLIFACYAAVSYVELDGDLYLFSVSGWQPIAVAEGLILLGMYFRHLYEDLRIPSRTMLLQQLSLIFGLTFIAEALMSYWNLDWALPRNILITGSALALAAMFLCRILFSLGLRNKVGERRVLFVGFSPTAIKLAGYLGGHPEFGLTPIGYLGLPQPEERPGAGLARLGTAANLPGIVDEYRPDWIVVAEQEEIQPRWVDDFLDLRFGGVHTAQAAKLYETTLGRVCISEIRPGELIFSEALQPDPFNLRLQPFYSIPGALVTILIALPLFAIIAILVKTASPGPVLLRERRIGRNGVPFTMFRFRCTRQDGSATKAGKLMRHLGLDALPQFWNVLRGEMSIVGPYPDRPEFAARLNELIPFHQQRTAVKPGMTGWAQMHDFLDDTALDATRRLEYDLYYVKNLSPSLDLSVILRWCREALVSRVFAVD